VDCTKSLAFATSTSLGKVYSTPLKQAGSFTCLASWFGVFPDDSSWSESFTVSFAFSGLLGNSSPATGGDASLVGQTVRLTPSYSLRLGDKVTVKELIEPQLVVSSITAAPVAGLTRVYETTVQLALGPLTGACTFPASVDIILGNGGAGCRAEMVPATGGVAGQYKWQHAYTPSDIANCGADAVSDKSFFKLPMTLGVTYGKHWPVGSLPADPKWCFGEELVMGARAAQCWGDKAWTRPTLAPGQVSTVLIAKSLVSDSTVTVSQVVLDTPGYSAAPGCPGVSALFSPMGVPQLTVRAKGASAAEMSGVIWSAVLDGATLPPPTVSDCGDADTTTQCAIFAAPGCQPMTNFAGGSCSFSNEDKAFSVTVTTSLGVTKKVLNAGLIFPGRKFTTCSVPLTTQDVTADYQVAFTASRENGAAGISLSQPIVGKLKLLNGNPSGALSFYILDVTVQMRVPGATTPLAARTFTREEKQRLMMSLSSPYYADAHWCRTVASATGACSSFYAINKNPLATALPAVYSAATTSGYKSCAPLAGSMNEDRFTFTPADWGFDRFAPANATALELRYVINALLTNCVGRRLLADDSDARSLADAVPQTIQIEGTQKLTADTCAKGKAPKTCAKTKGCLWTTNPTQALFAPAPRCYPKTTIGRWACENILTGTACALNPACKLVGKKCSLRR
jgi:hypothetical protein